MILFLLLLSSFASASEAPWHLKQMSDARDVGAVNENFRSHSGDIKQIKDDLATYPDSSNVPTLTGNNAFSGTITNKSSTTFSGGVFGNIHNLSTVTWRGMPTGGWGTTGLICKSTLTIVGSSVTIYATISHGVDGNAQVRAGFIIDGLCPSGITCSNTCASNISPWRAEPTTAGQVIPISIATKEFRAYGSHNICIWSCNSSGIYDSGSRDFLDFWLEAN